MQSGVLVIDKPVGPSSFDVVRRVRWAASRRAGVAVRRIKAGHGGTLDPMASGVLPICLGEGTKLAPYLLDADKAYEAEIQFGATTDTFDATGAVLETHPLGEHLEGRVRLALAAFVGESEQLPPMYSALKHKGKPLYAYARAGQVVERRPRKVHIFSLVPLSFGDVGKGRVRVAVRCSKGTYVRSLAADLGERVGTGAHLAGLRRTASGPFALSQAVTLAEVLAESASEWPLVSPAVALAHLPAITPCPELATALRQGRLLPAEALGLSPETGGQLRILRADGALLAIAEASEGLVRPARVFHLDSEGALTAPSASKSRIPEVDFGPPLVGKFNPV